MSAHAAPRCGLRITAQLLSIFAIAGIGAPALGAAIVYDTPNGSTTGGKPVSCEVSFVTSPNTVQITLTNKQANPVSAVQCLSGLEFHLSTGQTTGTLTSSSGTNCRIIGNGSYTDEGVVSTGWLLQAVASDLKLNDLGGDAPLHTIVGPPDASNIYAAANSSVKNGSHNPHLAPIATFNLNVPGVTAASTITSVIFQFNTSPGNTLSGIVVIPEPAGLSVLAVASLAGLARCRRPAA